MEKTTDILSIGLDRLDKEQALKAFANGAELSLFVQQEDGKIRMHDYQPTNKGGINQDMRIFAVPEAVRGASRASSMVFLSMSLQIKC